MEKEFGLYDREDLRSILAFRNECVSDVSQIGKSRFSNNLGKFSWHSFYNIEFIELIHITLKALGVADELALAINAKNPQKKIQELVELVDPKVNDKSRTLTLGSIVAVIRNIQSVDALGYPLSDFLARFTRLQNDSDLWKILSIDRTIVAHPAVSNRISKAEMLSDTAFFNKLGGALKKGPHAKRLSYRELRYLLWAIDDAGGLKGLTEEVAYDLFCIDLGLYPDEGDTGKSLMQFILRWKKARPT